MTIQTHHSKFGLGAVRKRCQASLKTPRKIAYSVTAVTATAQTRVVMDKLVTASKQASPHRVLANNVAWLISMEGSIWDMHAAHRARAELARHGVGTGSPEDVINVAKCPRAALRDATCRATETYSDAQRARRIMQKLLGAAEILRATPVPSSHAKAIGVLNCVLGDELASLRAYDPHLPWIIATAPKSIDWFRDCTLLLTAEGMFGVYEALENDFTKGLHAIGFVRARKSSAPVKEAGTRLLKRAIHDLEPQYTSWAPHVRQPNIATWTSGRAFLLPMIAFGNADEKKLRGAHADWRRVAQDQDFRRRYGRLPPKPTASTSVH